MKVVVASSSLVALPTITALKSQKVPIVGAISMPDAPTGRGRVTKPNAFAFEIAQQNIPIFKPASALELHKVLADLAPDLVITIAYGRLIRPPELGIPKFGWINLHFSLLPKYRGAAPVQRAIENGEHETGISIFKLDSGMDTGPIYCQRSIQLQGDETAGDLLNDLSSLGAEAIRETLTAIESGVVPQEQSASGVSLAPKIDKAETRIDWSKNAVSIDRKIRAFSPEPGAWTEFRGQRVTLMKSRAVDGDAPPGVLLTSDGILRIGTGSGLVEIQSVIPAGKREMLAEDWLRGARINSSEKVQ